MKPKSAVTFTLLLLLLSTFVVAQQSAPQLSADQIVQNMVVRNVERAQALKQYTGVRTYQCSYTGIGGDRQATMTVQARYEAPDKKDFVVVAQQGSQLIINRVFRRLLDSEKEALDEDNRSETALNSSNYNFSLLAFEDTPEGRFYVLAVEPKVENKFLYRGKIWVEANDFAVARIEAEPAKKPSFWIKETEIRHRYTKVGEFWLPAENRSTSRVRLGGTATLVIEYRDYSVNSPLAGADQSSAKTVIARFRR
jgi:outer membrane lipoprotein-sorting protein